MDKPLTTEVVSSHLCSDVLGYTCNNIDRLEDALSLVVTNKNHYSFFYDALIDPNNQLNKSLFITGGNYKACTKMLISCAKIYESIDGEENSAEKENYKKRFHALWRYSSGDRCYLLHKIIGLPSLNKSSVLESQIRMSLYSGTCDSSDRLKKALSVFLDCRELDLLELLIKRNSEDVVTFTDFSDKKGSCIQIIYMELGIGFIKKIIDYGIELKGFYRDAIPIGQSLISSAYYKDDEEMITFSLDQGVRNTIDFQRSDKHGDILSIFKNYTPDIKNLKILELLLKREYFNQLTKNQLLTKSSEYGKRAFFKLLVDYGADKSILSASALCEQECFEDFKLLIQKNPKGLQGYTQKEIELFFESAVSHSHLEMLEFLCTQPGVDLNGITVDVCDAFYYHPNILYYALIKEQFDAAKTLLKYGADIHDGPIAKRYNNNGWDGQTIDFLLKNGFSVTKKFIKDLPANIFICATIGIGLGIGAVALASIMTLLINGVQTTWNSTGIA